jgi:hypothetical protein
MGQLRTHDLTVLLNVEDPGIGSWYVVPGSTVMHTEDRNSFGVCISRRPGPANKPEQCEVLWSKSPVIVEVQVQQINAQSRKLKAKWSAEAAEDFNAFEAMDKRIAEDLLYGHKTMEEVMNADGDIVDIVMMYNAAGNPSVKDIEIKRRSTELRNRQPREIDDGYGAYDGRYISRIRY